MNYETNLYDDFYKLIERAYEFNYMCSFIGSQINPNPQGQVYSLKDILSNTKTTKSVYLDNKLESFANQRNAFMSNVLDSLNNPEIEEQLNKFKQPIVNCFNSYYHKNKTFPEIVKDDIIIDEDFYNDFYIAGGGNNSDNFAELAYNTSSYLLAYSKYKHILVARDIIETLSQEFNSNGYKSLYFGRPLSKDIFSLSFETINKLSEFANKSFKEKFKLSTKMEKNYTQEDFEKDPKLAETFGTLTSDALVLSVLSEYGEALTNRYMAYAKPDFKKSTKLKLAFYDMLVGVNPKDVSSKKNSIYVHAIELEEICAILDCLNSPLLNQVKEETGYNYKEDIEFTK